MSSDIVQSAQQQPTAQQSQPQQLSEDLEKAWTAMRNFWLDLIKEVEIEQELKKSTKKPRTK